ncbi:Cdc14-like protein phosphatase Clp1/Flp1 [Schizosaccharomyces japonicus yFS275]|uniref:protein-tyrosine-phosphatase n=1 Tax=Schizosaccharomyces japonicus (strain yFS275 / FY16936) TaxID=402676 RepID=B6JUY3_SCHJY|nr:Cdc14-like protein phosphatase Clp1/Flp1 [Schizosaccharomyces japonicus yFS275]EEB05087.1 Cdc14-like protein phosphatase Clp1/Flp1 [Schizosaccharomyces japonicus yFS275]
MNAQDDGMGEMIEFLEDKLYYTSLSEPPREALYPHMHFFTIDNVLLYNPFFHDFGPLNVSHLIRFAVIVHGIMSRYRQAKKNKAIVLYSSTDSRSRSNAACLLACYMVLVQNWPPHLALAPLAQAEPPFLPFRDAGYAMADYSITIQDCVYGVWRARECAILNIRNIDVQDYETHERVENGDFNWITPKFIAFASPIQAGWGHNGTQAKKLPQSFAIVLDYFTKNNVRLVVRLNGPLYDKREFERCDIQHRDMYFEDGTVPDLSMVKEFIDLTESVEPDGVIAVHCKAGLGRTGCLIGAYLMYKYPFTANEVIAFMRIMRPGMVVGPQQHWLHINQAHFRAYYFEKLMAEATTKAAAAMAATATPPRLPLEEMARQAENMKNTPLPAPTPGQPRKTTTISRQSPLRRRSTGVGSLVDRLKDAAKEQNAEQQRQQKQQSIAAASAHAADSIEQQVEEILEKSTPPKASSSGAKGVRSSTDGISVVRIRRSSLTAASSDNRRHPSTLASPRKVSLGKRSGPATSSGRRVSQRSSSMSSLNSTSEGRVVKPRSPRNRLVS